MIKLRKLALPILAGAGVLLMPAPAIAQQDEIVVTGGLEVPEGYEPVSRKVKINDLDLTTTSGVEEMEKRVGKAVKKVCSDVKQRKMRDYCHNYAWSSARPQMDEALEKARSG